MSDSLMDVPSFNRITEEGVTMPTLMTIDDASMQALNDPAHLFPETGMGLYVVQTDNGVVAVQSSKVALPCYAAHPLYDLSDLLAGIPAPDIQPQDQPVPIAATQVFANRLHAQQAIAGGAPVTIGPIPLFARRTLAQATLFLRFLSGPLDLRYVGGRLLQHTYLSTVLEHHTANSGFSAVGRFALPLPAPARYVFQYELPANTVIDVGTVAPMFGQAGGGVEVCLVQATLPVVVGNIVMPEF